MVDKLSKDARSALMRSVRQKDTSPEVIVRRAAHSLGARFRLHQKSLPGSPDMVFPSRKLCIFIHGCFWHRHPGCRLASTPGSNVDFWLEKFQKNVDRDNRKSEELKSLGWRVEVIWECETRNRDSLLARLKEILFP
ncbi:MULTISPECIES: very short patch repair endonuclease [Xanthomonas]|uniref:Very short patch repair endonuclease n=2 Tax=Xanthomonas arboricola TaxID=56448 RepID=A0AAP4KCZ5_9XANT|nr:MULTISPECIES: DNA mismatch endonuclease Vsr [Xanthomonas]MDN0267883.1 DNA mismatch endonuclease Vsr [Xanthomonas arboricola pv. pruni]MDN0272103.1 DNA mismatch endonuclease Vsr [Xanthomonas arboricola pv. pruni]MDN0276184.1 DNA mismatch endonuclease Vsr [Xanthomonas arboricola pv. pruni]MDN0284286.1 DNA mismatch endonuclease Vsr [Xanthomonas arboricola pv. pruni]MDN0288590.1 DNA mismatch endonuclease Vsr [Xanthomonas arboricola pv. pruni]